MQQHNSTYANKSAVIESGTTVLTGTVTRWSEVSIWVTFEDGKTYRFTRSQDGQFRRVGRTTDKYAAPLVFMNADDVAALVAHRDGKTADPGTLGKDADLAALLAPAPDVRTEGYVPVGDAELDELLAPMGWDVPKAPPVITATRIEFTEEQTRTADLIERVAALSKGWHINDADARNGVQTGSLSSFRIEPLIDAAGREEPQRWLGPFLTRMEGYAVISERGRLLEFLDYAEAAKLLEHLQTNAYDRYESWHKPNSTSNVDVEIKLAEHEAWQSVYRVATGKRFY